jgi:predicted aldo/keto reductase-like oxidoreductase
MEADFFTCVMPTYTPLKVKELAKQADALRKKNISIMAMKTKGELDSEAYPAQIRKLLTDPNVCTVLKGISSIDDLKAWLPAGAEAKTGFWMRKHYNRYAGNYEGCGLCGKCEEACPNNVATANIIRCIRYYNDAEAAPEIAAYEFRELACHQTISNCEMCGACEDACPQGIPVRREIRRAAAKWA